jgi:hypothetical protein
MSAVKFTAISQDKKTARVRVQGSLILSRGGQEKEDWPVDEAWHLVYEDGPGSGVENPDIVAGEVRQYVNLLLRKFSCPEVYLV